MKRAYLQQYIEDRKLRASLELMEFFALFKTNQRETIPFVTIFFRLADRALHHSSNVWSNFISDLNVPEEVLKQIPDDALINTSDRTSKYEIEAYLGAAKTLFEKNLVGIGEPNKQNLLGKSFNAHLSVREQLKSLFHIAANRFFQSANTIRNHAYHVNAQLRDIGVVTLLKRTDSGLAVTLPNVYQDAGGKTVDLVEIFILTHKYIEELIRDVMEVLFELYFQQNGAPSNGTYTAIRSAYGTMSVGLGPRGFEFSEFHETKESNQVSVATPGLG